LAEQGNMEAQFVLGQWYMVGVTGEQDIVQGVKWIRSSAEQGYAKAQHHLGLMYEGGMGVTSDNIKSYIWITIAEMNGYKDEYKTREVLDTILSPDRIDEARRLVHEWLENHKN
jgi:enhanced entry protein LpnE